MTDWLSPNPARRAVERYWLGYTVVWGPAAAIIMFGGFAEHWEDPALMALGVTFALGAALPPVLWPAADERKLPMWRRTAFKLVLSVVGFAFLMNYFCTPYFFDVLHMRFGFAARWTIRNNPVFLYLMTVAYFASYCVLVSIGHRLAQRVGGAAPRAIATCLAPFAVAFLETVLNANPFMTRLFCFDDMDFMLWFGTLSYGVCFVWSLWVWPRIDEQPGRARWPLRRVLTTTLAANMGIVVTFELLRHLVAPHFTTVVEGSPRDSPDNCLMRSNDDGS